MTDHDIRDIDFAGKSQASILAIQEAVPNAVFSSLDLKVAGFHGLHFRIDADEPEKTGQYVREIANKVLEIESWSLGIFYPLVELSMVSGQDRVEMLARYVAKPKAPEKGELEVSQEFLEILLNPDLESVQSRAGFDMAVKYFIARGKDLSKMSAGSASTLLERGFMPLVYNYGYQLITDGLSCQNVVDKVSPIIDHLLMIINLPKAFSEGIKRHLLINLFSPFPEGLKMLDTQPEELQGVVLHPGLVGNKFCRMFQKTLGGPLSVFSPLERRFKDTRAERIVGYFDRIGYQLSFETAVQGHLAQQFQVSYLPDREAAPSLYVETVMATAQGTVPITAGASKKLMMPDTLQKYSDTAKVGIIDNALMFISQDQRGFNTVNLTDYESIAGVLKNSPEIIPQVVESIAKYNQAKLGVFELFGFGVREIKLLGSRAPLELKRHFLEDALGL